MALSPQIPSVENFDSWFDFFGIPRPNTPGDLDSFADFSEQPAPVPSLTEPALGEEAATSSSSQNLSTPSDYPGSLALATGNGVDAVPPIDFDNIDWTLADFDYQSWLEQETRTTSSGRRGLVHKGSDSSLGSTYSRFGENTPPGRGFRLTGAYECPTCAAMFDVPSDLRQHERKHIPKDELPHPCTSHGCGERFLYPKDLRRHMDRRHPSSYPCAELNCGLTFIGYDAMERHMRVLHPTRAAPSESISHGAQVSSQASAVSQSPAPRGQTRQRIPDTAVERSYRENLNAKLERLRQAVPHLKDHVQETVAAKGTVLPVKPSKTEVIEGAVEHINHLSEEVDKLGVENGALRFRVEDLESWQAHLDLCRMLEGWTDASLETGPVQAASPGHRSAEADGSPDSKAGSRKRRAVDSLSIDEVEPIPCNCFACGMNVQCPKMKDLLREKSRLDIELKLATRNAEAWFEEQDMLAGILREVCGDEEYSAKQANTEWKTYLPAKNFSVSRRAKDWLVALRVLICAKKRAREQDFGNTEKALQQLQQDVDELSLQ